MSTIEIGRTATGTPVALPLRLANRHGLVTGATGTGKSRTLQRMAEQFSAAGVPVFAADVKGDLSGLGAAGDAHGPAAERAAALGVPWRPEGFPVAFFDLFGAHGLPIRTSVQEMGSLLLSAMLGLNETQAGAMAIAFRKSEEECCYLLTLNDLRWILNEMLEERETVCRQYGNVTASSISAIQRGILALESQGGDRLFGEPPFSIEDLLAVDDRGRGVVNLLHADRLLEAPKLYATFLLWLLTELFRKLPEVGDQPKPRLVFFFDEAHLLFRDTPKVLLQQIERLVRLVRSKGVGVYFVTQTPTDVPDMVLEQLGTRVMHALRAHTELSARKIKAAAGTLRPNPTIDAKAVLPVLGNGEALVSVFGADEAPAMVERVRVLPPQSQMGPISEIERRAAIEGSDLRVRYAAGLDEQIAHYQFSRRMKVARGIDPGPDTGVRPWAEGEYLKYVPYHVGIEPGVRGRSVFWQLVTIGFWGAVAWGCFRIAVQ